MEEEKHPMHNHMSHTHSMEHDKSGKAKGTNKKMLIIAIGLAIVLIVSAVQAVELSNLKSKLASGITTISSVSDVKTTTGNTPTSNNDPTLRTNPNMYQNSCRRSVPLGL